MDKYFQAKQGFSLTSSSDLFKMRAFIGKGPMRFAPEKPERGIQEQLNSMTHRERACFDDINDWWDDACPLNGLTDELFLRYARNSPGEEAFNKRAAWNVLITLEQDDSISRQLSLTATDMKNQLMTNTLFPLPGLKTKDNHDVLYMRPSLHSPKKTPSDFVVDNLAYCVNCMLEKESASTDGIAFLANMNGWSLKNYASDYWLTLMRTLQGQRIPMRVNLFLIVDAPRCFGKVWTKMKPTLSQEFLEKVHIIEEAQLSEFFAPGFEEFLPAEMPLTGRACTDSIVTDFLVYRLYLEHAQFATARHGLVLPELENTAAAAVSTVPNKADKKLEGPRKTGTFSLFPMKRKGAAAKSA